METLTKAIEAIQVNSPKSVHPNAIQNFMFAMDERKELPTSLYKKIKYRDSRGSLYNAEKSFTQIVSEQVEAIKKINSIPNQISQLKLLPVEITVKFISECPLDKIPSYYLAMEGRLVEVISQCANELLDTHPLKMNNHWKVILSHIPFSSNLILDLSHLPDLETALYALMQRKPESFSDIAKLFQCKVDATALSLFGDSCVL